MQWCCGDLRQRCNRYIGTAMQLGCSMNGPKKVKKGYQTSFWSVPCIFDGDLWRVSYCIVTLFCLLTRTTHIVTGMHLPYDNINTCLMFIHKEKRQRAQKNLFVEPRNRTKIWWYNNSSPYVVVKQAKCRFPRGDHSNTSVVDMRDQRISKHTLNAVSPFQENTPKREFCAILPQNLPSKKA